MLVSSAWRVLNVKTGSRWWKWSRGLKAWVDASWAGLGPEANKPEGGFQKGICQHQCPVVGGPPQKCVLPVSMSQGEASVASSLSERLSKISRWV